LQPSGFLLGLEFASGPSTSSFADTVHGQHNGLLKRGREEGRGRKALEKKLTIDLAASREVSKRLFSVRSPYGTV
jgi:hypothetical protein